MDLLRWCQRDCALLLSVLMEEVFDLNLLIIIIRMNDDLSGLSFVESL